MFRVRTQCVTHIYFVSLQNSKHFADDTSARVVTSLFRNDKSSRRKLIYFSSVFWIDIVTWALTDKSRGEICFSKEAVELRLLIGGQTKIGRIELLSISRLQLLNCWTSIRWWYSRRNRWQIKRKYWKKSV